MAQLLAAHHPQRVRSLLLTNGDTEIDSPPPALLPVIELAKRGEFVDAWLCRWHADRVLARSPEGIGGMCYADPAHPTDEAIEAYFAPLLATPRRKAMAHAYAVALERNALAGIGPALRRCPVVEPPASRGALRAPRRAALLAAPRALSRGRRSGFSLEKFRLQQLSFLCLTRKSGAAFNA